MALGLSSRSRTFHGTGGKRWWSSKAHASQRLHGELRPHTEPSCIFGREGRVEDQNGGIH